MYLLIKRLLGFLGFYIYIVINHGKIVMLAEFSIEGFSKFRISPGQARVAVSRWVAYFWEAGKYTKASKEFPNYIICERHISLRGEISLVPSLNVSSSDYSKWAYLKLTSLTWDHTALNLWLRSLGILVRSRL